MLPSWVNYGAAVLGVPVVVLDLYLGHPGLAAFMAAASALHVYIGHVKDKKNANPRN